MKIRQSLTGTLLRTVGRELVEKLFLRVLVGSRCAGSQAVEQVLLRAPFHTSHAWSDFSDTSNGSLLVSTYLLNQLSFLCLCLHLPVQTRVKQPVENLLELRTRLKSHGLQLSTGQHRLHVLIGGEVR